MEAREALIEIHRLLSVVVPKDQNDMIAWAVRSQDTVYTYAGAAHRVAVDAVENLEKEQAGGR